MIVRDWTLEGLAAVSALAGGGSGLREIASAVGRGPREVDLALYALLGRTPRQALAALNGNGPATPPPAAPKPTGPLSRFLKGMFG